MLKKQLLAAGFEGFDIRNVVTIAVDVGEDQSAGIGSMPTIRRAG
jgi:hypothetical protein